jgi:hypothetical protein
MRGGELQCRWAHRAKHDHPFVTELVEHGDHVVDGAFDEAALVRRDRIRRAHPSRVDPDVTAERRQPVEEPDEPGLVPHQVDGEVRRLGDEHVRRPGADDLVADATTIALRYTVSGALTIAVCRNATCVTNGRDRSFGRA